MIAALVSSLVPCHEADYFQSSQRRSALHCCNGCTAGSWRWPRPARALGDDGCVLCRELDIPTAPRSIASPNDDCAPATRLPLCPAVHIGLGAGRPGRLCVRCAAVRNGRRAASGPVRARPKLRGISCALRSLGVLDHHRQRANPGSRSSSSPLQAVRSASISAASSLLASSRGPGVTCYWQRCCSGMDLRCGACSTAT
jgi:hypothetical protein